ncbi:hypothetical protein ACTFIV_005937 [Dictyostelium citrinum]
MNKLINILLISFLMIIDSNKFNFYPVGGECGSNVSFSCNNMVDALKYANTITNVHQIGFLLMDGIYDFTNNSIQVFGRGVGIASFNQGSVNVIFKGGSQNNNDIP